MTTFSILGKEPVGAYGIAMEILQAFVVILGLSILFSIISSVLTVSEEIRITFPMSKDSASQQTTDKDMRSGKESHPRVPDARHAGWRDVNAFAASKTGLNKKTERKKKDAEDTAFEIKTSEKHQRETQDSNSLRQKSPDEILTVPRTAEKIEKNCVVDEGKAENDRLGCPSDNLKSYHSDSNFVSHDNS